MRAQMSSSLRLAEDSYILREASKIMNILIAYDGSEYATAALDDLQRAGLSSKATVEVMSVANVWLPPPNADNEDLLQAPFPEVIARARKRATEELSKTREIAERGATRLSEHFSQWEVRPEAIADSPAWAIIKRASEWPADLIVVGSQGHSQISRLVLGSVSLKIIAESPCSVRIGRKPRRSVEAPPRILIGTDGSVDAVAAIAGVASRIWPAGSEARLCTAINTNISTVAAQPDISIAAWINDHDENPEAWVTRMIAVASEKLRSAGLQVTSLVKQGDPKKLLLDEAESWEADVIFVGAHGHRLFERLLLGSVSSTIALHAHCSVEIVRTMRAG